MANNRIYLRCRKCGNTFFLGKSFGGSYHTSNIYYDGKTHKLFDNDKGDSDAFLKAFNEFLDKHAFCLESEVDENLEPKFESHDDHFENRFEIAYETLYEEDE